MYRYSFLIFFIFLILNINAQPLPGKIFLKGSSEFTGQFLTTDYEIGGSSFEVKSNQFNFKPSIGRFVSHYILIGIFTGYRYQKDTESFEDNENDNYIKSTSLSIGPYIRGYLNDANFAPFIHGEFGYSGNKVEQQENSSSDIADLKMTGMNYELGIGFEYFVERKYSFEFLLNYGGSSVKADITVDDWSYSSSSTESLKLKSKGFGFRIGTSIFLN
jgi:hypothetical protein